MVHSERVTVAEIVRPQGNRGELLVRSQSDVPGRFETLGNAWVTLKSGADLPVRIVEAWPHKQAWVLKLDGVDTISEAEVFAGAELWVPLAERGKLPDDQVFRTDLLGCQLIDAATNAPIGVIEGWQQFGGPPLMESTVEGREVLIPFVPELCPTVDLQSRIVRVALPEGLLEL